jgi:hypothetical protein
VTELTPEQASEKCHKHLVAGLRLIRPAERVGAIAKAMQELEAREKRRRQSAEQTPGINGRQARPRRCLY